MSCLNRKQQEIYDACKLGCAPPFSFFFKKKEKKVIKFASPTGILCHLLCRQTYRSLIKESNRLSASYVYQLVESTSFFFLQKRRNLLGYFHTVPDIQRHSPPPSYYSFFFPPTQQIKTCLHEFRVRLLIDNTNEYPDFVVLNFFFLFKILS